MRRCPKCEERVLRRRYLSPSGLSVAPVNGAVEIDVCGGCQGVWLDWNEVGALQDLRGFFQDQTADWQRDLAPGRCPLDENPLERLAIGAYGVDRCPECLGLWFDGGELGPVLTEKGFAELLRSLRRHPA